MITPKRRHHFIPQMILRNFADASGRLWFWRRGFAAGEIKAASPEKLFVETDLYSTTRDDGTLDDSLEDHLADLETLGADFLRQFLAIVRRGQRPNLDQDAWQFWRTFVYMHMKRSPRYMTASLEGSGTRESITAALRKSVSEGGDDGRRAAEILADERLLEAAIKTASVGATAAGPTPALANVLDNLGISVYRAPPDKAYILSDIGFARSPVRTRSAVTGQLTFVPIAPDVALGFSIEANQVSVGTMSRDDVRRMNVAMAAQSLMIAGNSETLLRSLSRTVPFTGMPAFAQRPVVRKD